MEIERDTKSPLVVRECFGLGFISQRTDEIKIGKIVGLGTYQ